MTTPVGWDPLPGVAGPGGTATPSVSARRTAGGVTVPGSSFTTIDAALDLTLPAVAGDVIEVGVSGLWDNASGQWSCLDAVTRVAGANVNFVSTGDGVGGLGVMAWFAMPGSLVASSGSILYTLQAGDIDGGNVTVRLLGRTTSGGRVLRAGAGDPLQFWMKNLG